MINKTAADDQNNTYKFAFAWILLTLSLLFAVFFTEWQYLRLNQQNQILFSSAKFSFRFEQLLNSVLKSALSLNIEDKSLSACNTNLLPAMQSVVFNNPLIAGMVISDRGNTIHCATVEINGELPPATFQNPMLWGPLKINKDNKEVFLLEYRMGSYNIGIYLLKSLVINTLKNADSEFEYIGIYDHNNKKIMAGSGDINVINNNLLEQHNHDLVSTTVQQDKSGNIILPLQSLDNVDIIAHSKTQSVYWPLLFIFPGTLLMLSGLSYLLYCYLKKVLLYRYSLQYALNLAIKLNQFYPVYQPIWNISQNRYCGAEVLVRWHSDFDKIIMPASFIDEAERSGIIINITLQLIEKALAECEILLQKFPYFYLTFNMSPSHFLDNDFLSTFKALCIKYHTPAQQIILELTEQELFDQKNDDVVNTMQALRDSGFSLAIDDFGTGHASITYLRRFPFNYLKMDKIFIQAIGTGAVTETLNKPIIEMANLLGLTVVAEGVESKKQLAYLQENKVNLIQGWLFSRAMTGEKLSNFIDTGSNNE